jgi:hypothetical protein
MIESGARARKVETPLDVDMESQPDYMRDIKAGHYTRRKESPPVCVPVRICSGFCGRSRLPAGLGCAPQERCPCDTLTRDRGCSPAVEQHNGLHDCGSSLSIPRGPGC